MNFSLYNIYYFLPFVLFAISIAQSVAFAASSNACLLSVPPYIASSDFTTASRDSGNTLINAPCVAGNAFVD